MKEDDVKTLIRYRLDQARTALSDASFLMEGGRSSQSIVNRLYYAMFYATLALLQKIKKTPSKHAGVISLFDKEFVRKGIFPRGMSRHFHRAFELRQSSDYKVMSLIPRETIDELFEQAHAFIESASQYLQEISSVSK